jgi:hypothetical protein
MSHWRKQIPSDRSRIAGKRCLSQAADMAIWSVEVAYYPMLMIGIAMILFCS